MQKKKQIAVLGYGVVGSGVVELFYQNQEKIEKNTGYPMDIKYILDLRTFEGDPYADKVVHDINVILQDPEVGYVAECMGGVNPAFEFVSSCLKAGKSVSTSNKQLVAEKGDILLQIAKENNCNFFFEASVGGAIPIMRPLHTCLAANDLYAVAGILNGTTNFILEKMFCDQMSFADALALAQQLGYAERNPSADVDGADACRKICIISSLVFGKHVYPDSVFTKGIRDIQLEDVKLAQQLGGTGCTGRRWKDFADCYADGCYAGQLAFSCKWCFQCHHGMGRWHRQDDVLWPWCWKDANCKCCIG